MNNVEALRTLQTAVCATRCSTRSRLRATPGADTQVAVIIEATVGVSGIFYVADAHALFRIVSGINERAAT